MLKDLVILFNLGGRKLICKGVGLSLLLKNWLILEIGLREWARTNFDSINLHKLDILHEIKNLDAVKETCNFTESEHNKDYELRQTMRNILIQKEVYWHQCTSLTWLKEGDSNTKFFHIVANVGMTKTSCPTLYITNPPLKRQEKLERPSLLYSDHNLDRKAPHISDLIVIGC